MRGTRVRIAAPAGAPHSPSRPVGTRWLSAHRCRALCLHALQLPVPAVLIHAPRVNLSEAALLASGGTAALPLSGALQLWGPFNDVPSHLLPVPVLDLGGTNRTTPLFNLSGTGQVFITRLVRLDSLCAACCVAVCALVRQTATAVP